MKTLEELTLMSKEELVTLVRELQEKNERLSQEKDSNVEYLIKTAKRNDVLSSVVKGLSSLL